ncbi:hypothetical protein HYQ46_012461 [Verticillium longisporum]|nr:hypothetical protein HYQ46_012461 [Verticillium longisporum]
MVEKMTATRHPCVSAYRRSGLAAEIQHQFPPTGAIWPMAVAVTLVATGTTQTAPQMVALRASDALGMYTVPVTVRSVTSAMARMEKSAACTESWPTKPLTVQAAPGWRPLVRMVFVTIKHGYLTGEGFNLTRGSSNEPGRWAVP